MNELSQFVTGTKTDICYTLKNWRWEEAVRLLKPRAYGSAISLHDGTMMVTGGIQDSGIVMTSEIISWNHNGYSVTRGPRALNKKMGHCSVTAPGFFTLEIGGYDGLNFLDDVEELDRVWRVKASRLREPRFDHSCTVVTDTQGTPKTVLVIGGYGKDGYLNTTETMNLENFLWTEHGSTDTSTFINQVLSHEDEIPNLGRSGGSYVSEDGRIFNVGGAVCGKGIKNKRTQECERTATIRQLDEDGVLLGTLDSFMDIPRSSFAFAQIPKSMLCS